MDKKQFADFCTFWKNKGAMDFTIKSHYENLSPLVEAHAEALEVHKDEFVPMSGGQFYPHKETTDRIGAAAGISFTGEVRITKQEDGAWVGTAYPQALGPDGKMIQWAPASYEFNPADRAKEELLRNSIKNNSGKISEQALELKTLEYKKVALRRADTGARVAAIISAIGMPTGFKGLFANSDRVVFLFSRIIVNTKNELVMNRALDTMFGAATMIAGPLPVAPQIAAPEASPVDQGMNGDFEDMGASEAFDADPAEAYRNALKSINDKYRDKFQEKSLGLIDAALADPATTVERFQWLIDKAKGSLADKGITI